MRLETHVDIARAKLRKCVVTRSVAERIEGGRAFLVVQPMGRPRMWSHSANAVLQGFREGIAGAPSGHGAMRLRAGIEGARTKLVARCETLIERELPDVGLAAVFFDGAELHVHALGPCRAYLHRRRQTTRLTSRDEEPGGLLVRATTEAIVALEPSDLVLVGTLTAFTSSAVARVSDVLEHDPETAAQVIAQLLTDPAEQAGTGAAVAVIRAR